MLFLLVRIFISLTFACAKISSIPRETAKKAQALTTRLDWKKIFMRSFTYLGVNHGCMTVCQDQTARACVGLIAEALEWGDVDAPMLDVEETVQLTDAIKKEANGHRTMQLMGKNLPENEEYLVNKEHKRPCRRMLDYVCPVACIRKDSGNLPNQKGYVPEYEPGAFEPQFKERYRTRYDSEWVDADFTTEFSVFDFMVNGITDIGSGLLAAGWKKIFGGKEEL